MSSNDELSEENPEKDTDEDVIAAPPKKRTSKAVKSKKSKSSGESNVKEEKKKRRRKQTSIFSRDDFNPTTVDMISSAIRELNERQGSSVLAIKNYIFENFKVNEDRFKALMKKALANMLKDNKIGRPKGQEEFKAVLVGRYVLIMQKSEVKETPRERPESLRKLSVLNRINKVKKAKGKKKKRKQY